MLHTRVDDLNVVAEQALLTPEALKQRLPLTAQAEEAVVGSRKIGRAHV